MDFNNIFALNEANNSSGTLNQPAGAPQIADGKSFGALDTANSALQRTIQSFVNDNKIKEIAKLCDGEEPTTKRGTFGYYKNAFEKSSRNMFRIVIITIAIAMVIGIGAVAGFANYKSKMAELEKQEAEKKSKEGKIVEKPKEGIEKQITGEGKDTGGGASIDNNQKEDDVQNLQVTCENSIEAQAKAKPGDVLQRKDGTKVKLTQGDITWAQQQLDKGAAPTAPANPVTQTGTGENHGGDVNLTQKTAQTNDVESNVESNVKVATATTVDNGANDAGFQRWKNQNSKNYQSMVAQAQASGQSDPEAAAYKMYKQGLASNDVNAFRAAQNANGMVDASGSGRTDGKAIRTMQNANLQQYNAQQIDNLANTDADFAKYIQFYKQKNPKMANATNEEIVKKVTGFGGTSGLYQTVTGPNGETNQVIPDEYKPMKAALDRAKALYKNKTVS